MIKIRAERGFSYDGYQAWVIDYRQDAAYVAKPCQFEFEPLKLAWGPLPEPTFRLPGLMAREFIPAMKKALAGFEFFEDKEDYEASKRIEKAMQAHIDSLKLVVDRTLRSAEDTDNG